MKFIEEVVVDEFLPTFRSMLAGELRDRGFTQSEVAELLGISQSAVSKYAHGDVEINEDITQDERVQELIQRIATGLAAGEMTQVQALVEAEVVIRQLERGDLLAHLHEDAFTPLANYEGPLDIHDPEGDLRMTERVRSSVRRGVRRLENTSGFTTLIPAVGSNLAEALPDAATIDDVAAIPGRILDVKGQVTIPGDPEFGVSEHVATVLLAARNAGNDARAVINIRYDEHLIEQLMESGYTAIEFNPEQDVERAVGTALTESPDVDVVYQTGGMGIEPICYILGPDATTVVSIVRDLL